MASQNRNYRAWSNIEEAKLVEALLNMVNTGAFKADNGYKSGYLQHLEQVLKEALPNSGILGKPHIESKLRGMKRDWQAVHDMLSGAYTSGFGYDSVTKCVTAEDPVWDSFLKVHKKAARWKDKPFPHYNDLCIIFGKDRAQGSATRDCAEMEEEGLREELAENLADDFEDVALSSRMKQSQSEETSTLRTRKRKARVDPVLEGFNTAVKCLGESLEKMSNKMCRGIEREEEHDKKASKITSEILKISSLTQSEKFKAIAKIRDDFQKVNMFWDLDEMEREAFVIWVLEE